MSLYYIEYGCSYENNCLIVEAETEESAIEYAEIEATNSWESYNSGDYWEEYPDLSDEDIYEQMEEDMQTDIAFIVELFDGSNELHIYTLNKQNNKAYEI